MVEPVSPVPTPLPASGQISLDDRVRILQYADIMKKCCTGILELNRRKITYDDQFGILNIKNNFENWEFTVKGLKINGSRPFSCLLTLKWTIFKFKNNKRNIKRNVIFVF